MADGFNRDEQLTAMQAELSRRDAVIRELRDCLLEGIITECEISYQDSAGEWKCFTPVPIKRICSMARDAVAKTEEWK